ncbi:hypothetical protein [Telmatospirillum sp.]|uniref:hypothetical protein n=1 Tax=Telmatospirillum sp. TaxID=2079197 RepID=UPI00283C9BB8|nr:hypothetical protein [Telmatospirillum sp.]MDR3439143.1 hypothetical protein [Telmatospirillum sp.]
MASTAVLLAVTAGVAQAADTAKDQQILQELSDLKAKMWDFDAMAARIQQLETEMQANAAKATAAKEEAASAKKEADDASTTTAGASKVLDKLSRGQLQIGHTNVNFSGFIEANANHRQHNELSSAHGSGLATPFPVQAQYHTDEFRSNPPPTRMGFGTTSDYFEDVRIKSKWEWDMSAGSNAAGTANGSNWIPRMRHAMAEVDLASGWHFVGGQTYSLTVSSGNAVGGDGSDSPNLAWSLLPGTELTSAPDDGMLAGDGAFRNVQLRVVKELTSNMALAASVETNTLNWSGYHGSSSVSTGLNTTAANTVVVPVTSNASFTSGTTPYTAFGTMPEIISKIGYDPTTDYHFEAWGAFRQYKDVAGAASNLPDVGSTYTGGMGASTFIKLIPSKLDLHVGIGYGSIGSLVDGAIPDVTYEASGKPVAVFEKTLWGEVTVHPNRNLDLLFQAGIEQGEKAGVSGNSTATAFGYGNPYGSGGSVGNIACMTPSTSSLTATCKQDTKTVWNVAFTPIWRIFNNSAHGHLDFLPQVQYWRRTLFDDQYGYGPHASNWSIDLAIRYFPF